MCPVCGYPGLSEPPRTSAGSLEICPCCFFQFGYSDDDLGYTYVEWRHEWISAGMPWGARNFSPPDGWDPVAQLYALDGGSPSKFNG
ncbi:hypothetical protein DDT46_00600 [Mycobacteroides abscessus]|nr:hypothetical protein DDT46_00600 [Mycobacteroides abscessus]